MRLNRIACLVPILWAMAGCGGGGGSAPTVTPASLAVTPKNPSVSVGATQQFIATAIFANTSTQNLTSSVAWNSSNVRVATIDGSGLATARAAGTTTIAATAGSASNSTTMTVPVPVGGNVVPITVNGSLCSSGSYPNKPCVSVTICTPGTGTCRTVTDILLDTGSTGLRIFKSALNNLPLPQVTVSAGNLAECITFVDGSADWGPVQTADVVLGGEAAVTVPIHVLDATFGTVPTSCGTPETGPAAAGFNGILGVGLFPADCGVTCESSTVGWYYACTSSGCPEPGTTVPVASQVQNPVASLPVDNNGVLVQLPAVSLGGAPSESGKLVLGIGTQANNAPSGVTAYPATSAGDLTTVYNGIAYNNSFIDTGSNAFFFNDAAIPACASPNAAWYCPATTLNLTATTRGATGSPSVTVPFQIGNATTLFGTGNSVFVELGGAIPGVTGFDWGLPFFYGRNVFVGIQGKGSSLGSGPYWAY